MISTPNVSASSGETSAKIDEVREFWNNNVQNWKVARNEPGTAEFFQEIEEYRFEKLHYLPRLVDFAGYKDQLVLDVGCGNGTYLKRLRDRGWDTYGTDISPIAVKSANQ